MENIYSCQGFSQGKNAIFNAKVREVINKNSVATLLIRKLLIRRKLRKTTLLLRKYHVTYVIST